MDKDKPSIQINAPVQGLNIGHTQHITQHVYPQASTAAPATPPAPLWNIPFAPNPFFTGREEALTQLYTRFQAGYAMALSQPQVMSGLGGIGKTQIAVEYAYRHCQDYQAVLWARASTTEELNASYIEIAAHLNLVEKDAREQAPIVQAVKNWLSTQQNWLLILDSADEPEILRSFLPPRVGGHLLLTTRAADVSYLGLGFGHSFVVETFTDDQGSLFLLQRAGLLDINANLKDATSRNQNVALKIAQELGGLPLALDQAGAYIAATQTSLDTYLQLYHQHRTRLLSERRSFDYPESVATTWSISFECVEARDPAAAALLCLCAFLAPDAIPEALLTEGAKELGPVLAPVAANPLLLNEAIAVLRAYSLLARDPSAQMLSIHRLVQAVVRIDMDKETQRLWAEHAVRAVNRAFPDNIDATISELYLAQDLMPHAETCATLIDQYELDFLEAADLLYLIVPRLEHSERYKRCERLYRIALAIREKKLGPRRHDTVDVLYRLAGLYQTHHQFAQAELLFHRILTIKEKVLETWHPDLAEELRILGWLAQEQGKYEQADQFYKRAFDKLAMAYPINHPDTAKTLHALGVLYQKQGRYEKAEGYFQTSLMIYRAVNGGFDSSNLDVSDALMDYAKFLREIGRMKEAQAVEQNVSWIRPVIIRANTDKEDGEEELDDTRDLPAWDEAYKFYEEPDLVEQLPVTERETEQRREDAATHIRWGKTFNEQQAYELAWRSYTRAIALVPEDAPPHAGLGDIYKSLKDYERAIESYTRALELDPTLLQIYTTRGTIYYELKEYEHALLDYTRALEFDSTLPMAYLNRGVIYFELKEYEKAMKDYTRAAELSPGDAAAFLNRANAHLVLHEYEQALNDYSHAVILDPQNVRIYYNRGHVYRGLKEYRRAIDEYTHALELNPQFNLVYQFRGAAYNDLKEYKQALQDYHHAVAANPQSAEIHYRRGYVYYSLKEYRRAIEDYTRALELDPQFIWAYMNRGLAYYELEAYEQAVQDFEHALILDATYASVYFNRGLAYLGLRNTKQALEDFHHSWELDQINVNALLMAVWIKMGKERPGAEIVDQLEAHIPIHSQHYGAYVCRGIALMLQGQLKEGLRELEQAITLEPECWDAYFWKGILCTYSSKGSYKEARKAIEKSLELKLPPILLNPLYWLEKDRSDVFLKYMQPLLLKHNM